MSRLALALPWPRQDTDTGARGAVQRLARRRMAHCVTGDGDWRWRLARGAHASGPVIVDGRGRPEAWERTVSARASLGRAGATTSPQLRHGARGSAAQGGMAGE